ncbi:hypothetical protein R3I94_008191 [Phoxinus phoxinus]
MSVRKSSPNSLITLRHWQLKKAQVDQ